MGKNCGPQHTFCMFTLLHATAEVKFACVVIRATSNPNGNPKLSWDAHRCLKEEREGGTTYEITTSIVELYNEQVGCILHLASTSSL